jgi:hypothetical protein
MFPRIQSIPVSSVFERKKKKANSQEQNKKRNYNLLVKRGKFSLSLRNRRNSFFYSQSYSNDITLLLLAYHQSQGWTNIILR